MSTPSLARMLKAWRRVTKSADPFLDGLTNRTLQRQLLLNGKSVGQTVGSALRRVTYHYWYHVGEIQAIRQMLGHTRLPDYVGDMEAVGPLPPRVMAGPALLAVGDRVKVFLGTASVGARPGGLTAPLVRIDRTPPIAASIGWSWMCLRRRLRAAHAPGLGAKSQPHPEGLQLDRPAPRRKAVLFLILAAVLWSTGG